MVTKAYSTLVKQQVQLKYPNFYFEKGAILYDYDHEHYVYLGYDADELRIIMDAAASVIKNHLRHN